MPIPKPTQGETQQQFVKRCYETIKDEYDRPTAFAICYSTYKNKDK